MMKKILLTRLFFGLCVASLLAACATGDTTYWVPPNAPPTQPPALAFLSGTDSPQIDLFSTPTPTAEGPAPPLEAPPTLQPTPEFGAPATESAPESTAPPAPAAPTSTPSILTVGSAPILYYAQAADTLPVVAVRFGVAVEEISSPEPIPERAFINPGQLLLIPRKLSNTTSSQHLIPDSEVVFSPSAINFDPSAFASQAGGYLASMTEWHRSTGMKSGAEILLRVAAENSINPRLLMALLEYHSGWVYGQPLSKDQQTYPMGHENLRDKGLYGQLVWAVNQISIGYYAYREGRLTTITFKDGVQARLAPDLNAGTAALQYYFAQISTSKEWLEAVDLESGFPSLHAEMFGNPWERAQNVEPLFPTGITQPPLILPFGRNWVWSYTGGPHGAWEHDGAYAALDFAPGTTKPGCNESTQFAVAMSAGLVVRTGMGLVVLDLDGDGYEQTGWVLVYLHLSSTGRVNVGDWVAAGDPLGHPSCEGGFATGTHLHIARKFNGEWVPADGPLPFNLGGWIAQAGAEAYKGFLTRDGVTLTACTCSNYETFITRTESDP